MFTKIATGILWFFIVVGILFSLIAGGGACKQDGSFWWIAPVGIISTLLIATGMGVVVELANNVAKCKKYLKILAGDTSVDDDDDDSGVGTRVAPQQNTALFKNVNITPANPTSANNQSNDAYTWKCPECGEVNDKYTLHCTRCGKHKPK